MCAPTPAQQPGLQSRKRKGQDAAAEPPQPHVKAKLAVLAQPASSGAARGGGATAGKARGEEKDKAAPNDDEKLEHARSKIADLERQLQESELRTSRALGTVAEYESQAKTYGSLHKKLVVLRFRSPVLSRARLLSRGGRVAAGTCCSPPPPCLWQTADSEAGAPGDRRGEEEKQRQEAKGAADRKRQAQSDMDDIQKEIAKMKQHRQNQLEQLDELKQEKAKLRLLLDTADSPRASPPPVARRGGGSLGGGGGRSERDREPAGARAGRGGRGDREASGRGPGGREDSRMDDRRLPSPRRMSAPSPPPRALHHRGSDLAGDVHARAGKDDRDRHGREGPREAWHSRDARHDRPPQGSAWTKEGGGGRDGRRGGGGAAGPEGAAGPGARNGDGGHVQPAGAVYAAAVDADAGDM